MTLIEALKSGKRFRREGDEEWYGPNTDDTTYYQSDILADDWEIEPEPKPKLKAWINKIDGLVRFLGEDEAAGVLNVTHYTRAPWLDQPE